MLCYALKNRWLNVSMKFDFFLPYRQSQRPAINLKTQNYFLPLCLKK